MRKASFDKIYDKSYTNGQNSSIYNYARSTNLKNVEKKSLIFEASNSQSQYNSSSYLLRSYSADNVIKSRGFKPSDRHDPAKRNFLEHLTSKILHFDMDSQTKTINLQKLLTPAMDSVDMLQKKHKKMYASSCFYAPTHPTVEDQVELARRISYSLSDVKNLKSKGQSMYVNRKKRSVKWIHDGNALDGEDEPQSPMPRDKMPLKCVMNPNGKVLDIQGIQALGEEPNIGTSPLNAEKLFDIVRDLNNQKGRGAEIFAKRRKRSEKWIVDEDHPSTPNTPSMEKAQPTFPRKMEYQPTENTNFTDGIPLSAFKPTNQNNINNFYNPFTVDLSLNNSSTPSKELSRGKKIKNENNHQVSRKSEPEVIKIYLKEVAVGTDPEYLDKCNGHHGHGTYNGQYNNHNVKYNGNNSVIDKKLHCESYESDHCSRPHSNISRCSKQHFEPSKNGHYQHHNNQQYQHHNDQQYRHQCQHHHDHNNQHRRDSQQQQRQHYNDHQHQHQRRQQYQNDRPIKNGHYQQHNGHQYQQHCQHQLSATIDDENNEYTPVPVKQLIQEFEKTCRPVFQYKQISPKAPVIANPPLENISRFFDAPRITPKFNDASETKYNGPAMNGNNNNNNNSNNLNNINGNNGYMRHYAQNMMDLSYEEDTTDDDELDDSFDESSTSDDCPRMNASNGVMSMNDYNYRRKLFDCATEQLFEAPPGFRNGDADKLINGNGIGNGNGDVDGDDGDGGGDGDIDDLMQDNLIFAGITSQEDIQEQISKLRKTPILDNLMPIPSADPNNEKLYESTYSGPKISSYQNLTNYNTAPRGWDQAQSFYRPVTFSKPQAPMTYSDF